jgi:hypothetical protein
MSIAFPTSNTANRNPHFNPSTYVRQRLNTFEMEPTTIEQLEEYFFLLMGSYLDISEHLPTLRRLASVCDTVVELGTRCGNSTFAMIMGVPEKVISVDIEDNPVATRIEAAADIMDVRYEFIKGDSRTVKLPRKFDMLFVDSEHTFEQVSAELLAHKNSVTKYIVFHDTESNPDIIRAIWRELDSDFELVENYVTCNGLWVMKRSN